MGRQEKGMDTERVRAKLEWKVEPFVVTQWAREDQQATF